MGSLDRKNGVVDQKQKITKTQASQEKINSQQDLSYVPAKHFSKLFIRFPKGRGIQTVGIDRRNGSVWVVSKAENQFYKGKTVSYQEMYNIISDTAHSKNEERDSEFLHINSDNWREFALFLPGNRYILAEGSYETLGCGMHYGTVRTFSALHVEKDGYHFSGKPTVVPFGYFANKSYEEIESFLVSVLASSYLNPSDSCNMYELVFKLRDSDIFNKIQIDAKIDLLQKKKEQYNNLSVFCFFKKLKIAREIRKINEDIALPEMKTLEP